MRCAIDEVGLSAVSADAEGFIGTSVTGTVSSSMLKTWVFGPKTSPASVGASDGSCGFVLGSRRCELPVGPEVSGNDW